MCVFLGSNVVTLKRKKEEAKDNNLKANWKLQIRLISDKDLEISMMHDLAKRKRTKHVDRDQPYVKEIICTSYASSAKNCAKIFRKLMIPCF